MENFFKSFFSYPPFFRKGKRKNLSKTLQEEKPFWERKSLEEMTEEEWESLCDGCGKCCLMKTRAFRIHFTNVACPLLDINTGKCKNYALRQKIVPECLKVNLSLLKKRPRFVPKTCAYYLILHHKKLPDWHPLISKDKDSVHRAQMSVKGRAVSYNEDIDLEKHHIKWKDL